MKRRIFLTRRKQFARVARLGKSSGGGWGRLRFVANKKKAARLGVSVSKKWVRRAVKRNRLRRLLRETFRQQWRAALPPADILFVAAAAPPADEKEAMQQCARLFFAIKL